MVKQLMVVMLASLVSGALHAAVDTKPASIPAGEVLTFGAPPRESAEAAAAIYQPLVDYLSKVTGKRIVLKYPRTWGVYRTEMINGRYDIVFDGPHFVGYRAEKLQHTVLAKLSDMREFAIVARKTDKAASVAGLSGRTFCTQSPPNLAALISISQFEGLARQPILVPVKGFDKVFAGVASGKCAGGVMPVSGIQAIDKEGILKILYKSQPMPEQALSAGPRVSSADQAKIAAAMTSPDAVGPTEKLRASAKGGPNFVAASNKEYLGLGGLLKTQWGFYDN